MFQVPESQGIRPENRFEFQLPGSDEVYSVPKFEFLNGEQIKLMAGVSTDNIGPDEMLAVWELFSTYECADAIQALDAWQIGALLEAWASESAVTPGESSVSAS